MNNVLITGSSRGLGRSLKSLFNLAQYSVFELDSTVVDLTNSKNVENYCNSISNTKFETVIINAATAGLEFDHASHTSDFADKVFKVNFINQIKIVDTILPNINKKLVFITSHSSSYQKTSSLSEPIAFRKLIYRCSKISLNLAATYYQAIRPDLDVYLINPGSMDTGFEGKLAPVKDRVQPFVVAESIYSLIKKPELAGKFISWDGIEHEL